MRDALLEVHTDVIREELAKNRAEARKLAFLEMGEEDNNENAIAEVPVSFDGTWSRRGYSANHCVSFVISAASEQWTTKKEKREMNRHKNHSLVTFTAF